MGLFKVKLFDQIEAHLKAQVLDVCDLIQTVGTIQSSDLICHWTDNISLGPVHTTRQHKGKSRFSFPSRKKVIEKNYHLVHLFQQMTAGN